MKTCNSFDTDESKTLIEILEAFESFAIGANETYERFLFNSRNQRGDESIDSFVADLRVMAQTCNFCACR